MNIYNNRCTLITLSFLTCTLNAMENPTSDSETMGAKQIILRNTPRARWFKKIVNQQDKFGNTPLHVMVSGPLQREKYYPECPVPQEHRRRRKLFDKHNASYAALLILYGASLNIKNDKGYTPWSTAQGNKANYPKIYAVAEAGKYIQDHPNDMTTPQYQQALQTIIKHLPKPVDEQQKARPHTVQPAIHKQKKSRQV